MFGAAAAAIAWKAIGATITIVFCAWATAFAQARVGTAGAGAIAEKPEAAGMIIALEALPELVVIMGFVVAAMIITAK
ncbi:MAG: ATPase [Actinobacteria bacterium]|nr:MAG: ATPase [Actinomycetota bacterium]